MRNPKVSVVVLSYNNLDKTINCINSILKTKYSDFEIILVDNGSSKETVGSLEKRFSKNKKIKLILKDKNLGAAEGRNVGFRNSSIDSKYIAFFDNDTIIPPDYIGQLVKNLEEHSDIFGVNGAFCDFKGNYPSRNTTFTIVSFDSRYIDKSLEGKHLRKSVALTGSGCMYDKKFISPEPFFADYFFGGEEVYLGLLVYLRGGKCMKVLNAPYKHLCQKVFQGTRSPLASFHATKNRLMSLFLFFEKRTLLKILPLIFISQLFYFFYFPRLIPSKLKAYFWLISNYKKLRKKRKELQKQRKVPDSEILKYMSGKFQDVNIVKNKFYKRILFLLNNLFLFHCKLFRIKTREFFVDGKRSRRLV